MEESARPGGLTGEDEGTLGRFPGDGAGRSGGELPEEDRHASESERERESLRACPLTHVLRLSCHPLREVAFHSRCDGPPGHTSRIIRGRRAAVPHQSS
jgi:hypothetical protein